MPKGDYWKKITKEEKELRIKRREETNLKKYNSKTPFQNKKVQEKIKQTNLERYGVENPSQSLKIKEKKKQTNLRKRGVEYPLQNKKVQNKMRETNLERYGVENPSQNKKVQNKTKETNLKKYGVEYPVQNKKVQNKMKETKLKKYYIKLFQSKRLGNLIKPLFSLEEYKGTKTEKYKFQCVKCNTIFESYLDDGHIPRCFKCYPIDKFTNPHRIVCEYLEKENVKFEMEKFIKPYYVDIFIEPDKIIEVYGDYWHGNPKFFAKNAEIGYINHKRITVKEKQEQDIEREKYLQQYGNKLLILWEDEINNNFSLVEKKIKNFTKTVV